MHICILLSVSIVTYAMEIITMIFKYIYYSGNSTWCKKIWIENIFLEQNNVHSIIINVRLLRDS